MHQYYIFYLRRQEGKPVGRRRTRSRCGENIKRGKRKSGCEDV